MRRRNREVNIFNMSLLDILCGALGAFCFMMLSLFPDHAKVKDLQARLHAAERSDPGDASAGARARQAEQQLREAQKQLEQAKAEQSLLWFRIAWDGGQDVDLWIEGGGGKLCSPKPDLIPPERRSGTCKFYDQTKGPAYEQGWFSDVANPGAWFRLFARLENSNGVPGPASVHGYMVARAPAERGQVMNLADFGVVSLPQEKALVELGWIQFAKDGFTFTRGAKPDGDRISLR